MIIVRLYGGMGNQMFQYAAARRLQLLHEGPLKLDLGWFSTPASSQPPRPYALGHLAIQAESANDADITAVTGRPESWAFLKWGRDRLRPRSKRRLRRERTPYRYEDDFIATPIPVYLDGYWQNERYFDTIADTVRREFRVCSPCSPATARIAATLSSTTAVSVHVRRGDYANQRRTNRHHGLCPIEYYTAACNHMESVVPNPHYFVFSDEPDWAHKNLSFSKPATFVGCNDTDHQYEDLHLMTMCRHHIVANSSFSWWGAWLAESPGQVVIAPRRWVAANLLGDALIPARWVRL
jgi:hypothetical protein